MSESNFLQFENPAEFLLESVPISGLTEKFKKYHLSFKPPSDVKDRIKDLVIQHGATYPISRGWFNLKIEKEALSDKRRTEILDKGKMIIKVKFSCEGVYTKDDMSYLTFRVIGMKKIEDQPVVKVLDDI